MKKRGITIVGDIAYVPLTRGYTAIIDATDADLIGEFNWYANVYPRGKVYALRSQYVGGKMETILLHRLLLNPPESIHVDHINNDGLNNRRFNLRLATKSENGRNRGENRNNKSGFKGVSWDKFQRKWKAQIMAAGKKEALGYYPAEELAHAAYCEAAERLHGKFANLGRLDAFEEAGK